MQIHVGSKHLVADVAVALDVAGREHLVIVTKATWSIPAPGQRPRPLPPQPLALADEYLGEPGLSPMRYGADMARFKPRCDVLFDARAHAPDGQSVTQLLAGFEIGEAGHSSYLRKLLRVHGPRRWQQVAAGLGGYRVGNTEAFTSTPLHHGLAFGGSRNFERRGQPLCEAHLYNPVGLGWAGQQTLTQLHNQPAPQLEHPEEPVMQPDAKRQPHALSAVGRHWMPRRRWAGTYDEAWRREVFPLLPADFDEQFHQCAPLDQQMPYLHGGEAVRLINLLPQQPDLRFKLPALRPLVRVLRSNHAQEAPLSNWDTLYFETEQRRFSAVWRASVVLKRSIQDVKEVAVGPVDPIWWRDRVLGKPGCAGCADDVLGNTQPAQETGLA